MMDQVAKLPFQHGVVFTHRRAARTRVVNGEGRRANRGEQVPLVPSVLITRVIWLARAIVGTVGGAARRTP